MKIGITGASGFIGSRIVETAREAGHEPIGFSRQERPGFRVLNDQTPVDLGGLDAVMNLAGESVFDVWTAAKKERILKSRVETTRRIVQAMSAPDAPKILVNASAIGFYGETGENQVDEGSPSGQGFLAEVCRQWEAAALEAEKAGVRVVCIRTGFVIGRGGAMKLIKPVFSLGLGGNLGNGQQWMSGVHVDDVAGLFLWAAENDAIQGPVNAVMPEPFRNQEFTRETASVLHRPAFLPAPAFAMRIVLGELSSLMLDSSRVVPAVASQAGYAYRHPTLRGALEAALR